MRPALLALLLLAACGRPLAPAEIAFLSNMHGATLDTSRVRVAGGLEPLRREVPTPPRVTCQSRLFPPIDTPTFVGASAGLTLFDLIVIRDDWYAEDMSGGAPERIDLAQAMLLAHETLHAWQWQHRDVTGYSPLRAAREHVGSPDPYLFDPDSEGDFLALGYEQQGAVMEEYVCCRVLAPEAERTQRLHRMIGRVFPVTPLSQPLAREALLPWDGVEVEGICG